MPVDARELLVFVASPSDVEEERETVRRTAANLNAALGTVLGLRLRVTGWEDVRPELGRPQAQVNPLVDECDIFIGVLNRRWGSATGTHTSGFEEEFEGAASRRAGGDVPAVAVYFRRVPPDVLADPGPELQKVLAFRQRLRDEHQALYHEFETSSDLEVALMKHLSSALGKAAKETTPRSPEGTVTVVPSHPSPAVGGPIDRGREEIANTLKAFETLVRGVGSAEHLDRDRLLLFAQAIHSDAALLQAHPANRLYQRRSQFQLSVPEFEYWLRSLVSDIAASMTTGWDRVLPGWFLLTPQSSSSLERLVNDLVDLIADDDDSVARGALVLLTELRARPPGLWSGLTTAATKAGLGSTAELNAPAAQRWAAALVDPGRRDAGLEYLLKIATRQDLSLLDQIASELRDKGGHEEVLAVCSHLRGDATSLALSLAGSYSAQPWQEQGLLTALDDLPTDCLQALVKGSHGSTKVRRGAIEALCKRRALDLPTVVKGLKSEELRGLIFKAAKPPDAAVSPETLLDAVGRIEQALLKSELKARAAGATTSLDELRVQLGEPLSGVEAWEAMSWTDQSADLADEARRVLDTDAESFIAPLSLLEELEDAESVVDWFRSRARCAALRILSKVPLAVREDADLKRARAEVARDHWLTKESAVRFLAVVGKPEDVPLLLSSLDDLLSIGARDEVLGSVLAIGGFPVARELIKGKDERNAFVGARALSEAAPSDVLDVELIELLYDKRAPVRSVALDGLRKRWSRQQLEELLGIYSHRPDGYYYNVVAELDRLLYAPADIATAPVRPPLA
ncbi:MAG TPA: DUF4062 domain-containing protein [Acidimicrobiales bacterium]|nr:DUF4062 domain-containing protein [Acidimicrobiales bacterium]